MSWPSPMPGPVAFGQDSEQPQNADLLLEFLRRGGDQHQPYASSNEPWQLHDPAVAALGPSHSFPLPADILSPTPPRPVYLPRFGWSPQLQPEQTFRPDNPFLTPTDQAFFRPFVPLERPFHAPAAGYPLSTRAYPEHLLVDALRPQPPKFGTAELDTPTEVSRHKGRATADSPGMKDETLVDLHPFHQFHGNGAELLQLLQGGRGGSPNADAPLTENGEDASKLRGSPSTVHGPIGPPKRHQVVSPQPSSDDLLGRFWPVLPSSSQLLDESSRPSQTAEREHTENFYDEKVEESAEFGGVFSLLKRGSSKLPLDGFGQNPSGDAVARRRQQPGNGYSRTRVANGGADLDPGLDDFRRRRVNGRVVKGSAGQWVAVNDKHRDIEGVGNNYKESDEASRAQAKDLKRRRKQQQEWRIKSPQADSKSPELKLPRCRSLASQLEHPGLPCGSTQDSAVGAALDESKQRLYNRLDTSEAKVDEETITQYLADLDLDEATHETKNNNILLQKPRPQQRYRETRRYIPMHRKDLWFRPDLEKFTSQLISLYQELMPTDEEELSKKKFLSRLDALVEREWPGARLFLFGSCANAFGVCNSDIDVCLTVDEEEPNKAEVVMKMASILESDDMTNVQALPHARVPIVKFTDPVTQISCDICVNNMLAVVNSKLLHDYSRVDVRLRQLAFIVKHWAKRRKVNETYRGTLSSYAYVLMCIHFLQQRRPPILPCLQEMAPTYEVRVGHVQCSYYDQVENLRDFGARNNETLGELLTAFFEYWAHEHDYNHAVISVRTGGYLSKDEKNWTRRIGNERHLICIEDPFETSHDLGRVVDKHSIKALRGEFFRAANIMKSDPNPCVALFETYVRDSQLDRV